MIRLPLAAALVSLATAAGAQTVAQRLNDYPTEARADYVFACMTTNGQTREMLTKCSCSIDTIASIVPYETYVEAETVLAMQLVSGERTTLFKTTRMARDLVDTLRRAQAEAELTCF